MTLAPRVQVYTQLSCNALHQNYNHTRHRMDEYLFPASVSLASPLSSNSSFFVSSYEHDWNQPLPIIFPEVPSSHRNTPPVRDPSTVCATDPAVQAGAARLQTAIMTTMGVLSALTTGWWGHFSERYGRTKVLAASSFGLLITYVILLGRIVLCADAITTAMSPSYSPFSPPPPVSSSQNGFLHISLS